MYISAYYVENEGTYVDRFPHSNEEMILSGVKYSLYSISGSLGNKLPKITANRVQNRPKTFSPSVS